MKTVLEYLHTVDIDKLVNKYMWNYQPDTMEFMKHEEMMVGQYYELRKQAIHKYIERLQKFNSHVPANAGDRNIFVSYHTLKDSIRDVDFSMVSEKELKECGTDATFYSILMVPQEEVIGYYIADNPLTQQHLYDLLAFILHESSLFGFEQEHRDEVLKSLKESEDQIRNHPETLHSKEEMDEILKEKYGKDWDDDDESAEEKEFRRIALDAQFKYSRYSKKKELATLLSLLED